MNKPAWGSIYSLAAFLVLSMPNSSPAQTKWFFLAALSAFFSGWVYIKPRLGTPAAMLFAYCVTNGAWFWIFRENRYANLCVMDDLGKCFIFPETGLPMADAYTQMEIRFYAADGIAKLLLVIPPIFYAMGNREKLLKIGGNLSALFCSLNVGLVYFSFFISGHWCRVVNSCGGSLSNPSMNSSLIVVTLPFVIARAAGRVRYAALALSVGAVFLSKGSIGIGMLAVLGGLYAVRLGYWKLILAAPVPIVAGAILFGRELFDSSGRVHMWKFFISNLLNNPVNYAFGTGYGTFGSFSSYLQRIHKVAGNQWWMWLHNDWLEIFFILGVVGLVLSIAVYFSALMRFYCRGEGHEAISLVLLGLMMGVNYPLHHPISAAFAAWIVISGLITPVFDFRKPVVLSRHNC